MMEDDSFITNFFDTSRGLFPLADGLTMDFKKMQSRKRTKEDYFTRETDRNFVKISQDSRNKIVEYYYSVISKYESDEKPSNDYFNNLVEMMAYMLTGENNLKKFVNLIGNGDNGKSVFIELHKSIMGTFGVQGNKRTFINQKNKSGHDAELMSLINSRMVVLSELDKKDSFNEELLKGITGGDTQSVRGCGSAETINVIFQCVPLIATNEMAQFEGQAFKNRLVCVNFANKFSNNPNYVEELNGMKDEFFSFLCEYAKRFYDNNRSISFSEEINNFTNVVKNSQDSFICWINQECPYEPSDDEKEAVIVKAEVYSSYMDYIQTQNVKNMGKIDFYKRFEEHFNVKSSQKAISNEYGHKERQYVYKGLTKVM